MGVTVIAARLRILDTGPQARLRGRHADLWRTVSGWFWMTYLIGLAAGGVWLFS
jgi:hypothetical protein